MASYATPSQISIVCPTSSLVLLRLIPQNNMLFSINFSNGMRIVRSLVLLFLLHSHAHLLMTSLTLPPLVLEFHIQVPQITLLVINLFSFPYLLRVIYFGYHDQRIFSSHDFDTINPFSYLSIDNILYVPTSPFNLLSISRLIYSIEYVIYFTKDYVYLLKNYVEKLL